MAKFDLVVAAKTVGAASIKRLGNSMQGVSGKVKNLRLAMGGLNKTFATFGLIVSGGAFVGLVKGAIDSADSFGKLSDQTGIAANNLQAYVNAGKLAGISQETIDKGLRRLAQSMREADQGVATYADSFNALGLSVRDSEGNLKSSETVLGEIADRFADLPDGATKAAISMEIFGRSGASLINLLNGGSAALTEFNYAVSDEFAQNAEFFNDQIAVLAIRFDGFRKQLVDALLPTLNNLVKMFSNILSSDNDFDAFFKGFEVGLKIISSSVFTVVAGFRFLATTIKSITSALNQLRKGNLGGVGSALGGGLKETNDQLKKDMDVFKQIFTGEENAPATYFREGTKSLKDFSEEITKSFGTQMQNKLKTFNDSIKTIQESMADVVVKGIKGMEDALVDFVMTGKLNFKNLANAIIADMARIAIQQSITRPLLNFAAGFFGGMAGSGGKDVFEGFNRGAAGYANGGRPPVGRASIVGERGAELFVPDRAGTIIPNHKLGGTTNVVVNVDASGTSVQGNDTNANEFGKQLAAAIQSEIINQKRTGGLLA